MQTPAEAVHTYLLAKDGNRPHLLTRAFAAAAVLEIVVNDPAVAFPPLAEGVDAIAEVVSRRFGRTYENVYTFCLADPPRADTLDFTCRWLVGMSEKDGGAVRVGCGRYDWSFQPRSFLVERLCITIDRMHALPARDLGPVMAWLSSLPYPWCPPRQAAATAPPAVPAAVVDYIAGRQAAPAGS